MNRDEEEGRSHPVDKSLRYYGKMYKVLFDPLLKKERNNIIDIIPEGSRVLDVGCGTGKLSRLLKEEKDCTVVGVDLSVRMIDFANKTNPYHEVTFLHGDAANLSDYQENEFDFAVMCMVIHELSAGKQSAVLTELMRLAKKVILVDNNAPLPMNLRGLIGRTIEGTFGRDHHDNFKAFITTGGITGILERAKLKSKITHELVFNKNSRQLVVLTQEELSLGGI